MKPSFADSIPQQQQDKEVRRLAALATWVRHNGHLLTGLSIKNQGVTPFHGSLKAQLSIPGIIDALAAAGQRSDGLPRLQQLQVPALGNTPLSSICTALSSCRQLRKLDLGHLPGKSSIQAPRSVLLEQLPAALAQLTQLTSLHLAGGVFSYARWQYYGLVPEEMLEEDEEEEEEWADDGLTQKVKDLIDELDYADAVGLQPPPSPLDYLFRGLSSSLVELHLGDLQDREGSVVSYVLPSSLAHLKALQRLRLPNGVGMKSEEAAGGLAAFTALTSLVYPRALQCTIEQVAVSDLESGGSRGEPLQLPDQLVELKAEAVADSDCMEALVAKTALRSLGVGLPAALGGVVGKALSQLTHLTKLQLSIGSTGDLPSSRLQDDAAGSMAAYGAAVGALHGLRHLDVPVKLLRHLELGPLQALTHLRLEVGYIYIDKYRSSSAKPQEVLMPLLGRLAALAGGQLQGVELVRVGQLESDPQKKAALRDACRSAVVAAVGNVKVTVDDAGYYY
jgi:hypothetical protein